MNTVDNRFGRIHKMAKFVVLDTETAPTINHKDGKAHPETSLVYDFGYIIADNKGTVYVERSFIIAETFFNADLMKSAYYAKKLPQYREGMGKEWKVVSFLDAYRTFKADCKEHGVKTIWAYNVLFDEITLNNTIKTYSNGFMSWFAPYGMQYRDIWSEVGFTICNTKKYVKWAIENDFITASNNPSTGAETVYRYLLGDTNYVECHTALEDCKIELAMLLKAKRQHKKTPKSKKQGWRAAARIKKELEA